MLDTIIRNGSVVDGTGSPARGADIGIRAGKNCRARRGRRGRAPGDRRRRSGGQPRLHRRAYPPGCPGVLGPHSQPVTAPRGDHGGGRQLRVQYRPPVGRDRRLSDADARSSRGHAAQVASGRSSMGLELDGGLPGQAGRLAQHQHRLHGRPLGDSAAGHGGSGQPARRRPR